MLVGIQQKSPDLTGLNIGADNVKRYFPKRNSSIDLRLDHLEIRCDLQPAFWKNEPQIFDPRLSAWLKAKNLDKSKRGADVVLALIPDDNQSFRVQTVR
jgi:hypothetical protein